ncbi:MAG: AAA family ATPase [bacterium]|nr:AAA family ATPase [bacterium]
MRSFGMPTVVGIVGEKGSGKGTLVGLLAEAAPSHLSVVGMRFSDLHRETLALWDLPITRQNMQELSRVLVDAYGADVIARAMHRRIERTQADIIVVDGVRWEEDRKLIRSFPVNILVYVTASAQLRFERIRGRGQNVDDHQASFQQFMDEERALAEQSIARIGVTADIIIRNEGTIEEYQRHVQHVLHRVLTHQATPT